MMNWACNDTQHWGKTHPLWWIASWRISYDGYHQLWFLSSYVLHSSMNPDTVKRWHQADFNTLWTLISLFFIYIKSVVIRIAMIKFFLTLIIPRKTRKNTEQTVLWVSFLSVFLKYIQLFILHSTELQGRSGRPRQVDNNRQVCKAYVLQIWTCSQLCSW